MQFIKYYNIFQLLFCVGEFFGEKPEDNEQIDEFLINPKNIALKIVFVFVS